MGANRTNWIQCPSALAAGTMPVTAATTSQSAPNPRSEQSILALASRRHREGPATEAATPSANPIRAVVELSPAPIAPRSRAAPLSDLGPVDVHDLGTTLSAIQSRASPTSVEITSAGAKIRRHPVEARSTMIASTARGTW